MPDDLPKKKSETDTGTPPADSPAEDTAVSKSLGAEALPSLAEFRSALRAMAGAAVNPLSPVILLGDYRQSNGPAPADGLTYVSFKADDPEEPGKKADEGTDKPTAPTDAGAEKLSPRENAQKVASAMMDAEFMQSVFQRVNDGMTWSELTKNRPERLGPFSEQFEKCFKEALAACLKEKGLELPESIRMAQIEIPTADGLACRDGLRPLGRFNSKSAAALHFMVPDSSTVKGRKSLGGLACIDGTQVLSGASKINRTALSECNIGVIVPNALLQPDQREKGLKEVYKRFVELAQFHARDAGGEIGDLQRRTNADGELRKAFFEPEKAVTPGSEGAPKTAQPAEPKPQETKPPEVPAGEQKTDELKPPEPKAVDPKPETVKPPEPKPAEVKAPDSRAPEAKTDTVKPPDLKLPESANPFQQRAERGTMNLPAPKDADTLYWEANLRDAVRGHRSDLTARQLDLVVRYIDARHRQGSSRSAPPVIVNRGGGYKLDPSWLNTLDSNVLEAERVGDIMDTLRTAGSGNPLTFKQALEIRDASVRWAVNPEQAAQIMVAGDRIGDVKEIAWGDRPKIGYLAYRFGLDPFSAESKTQIAELMKQVLAVPADPRVIGQNKQFMRQVDTVYLQSRVGELDGVNSDRLLQRADAIQSALLRQADGRTPRFQDNRRSALDIAIVLHLDPTLSPENADHLSLAKNRSIRFDMLRATQPNLKLTPETYAGIKAVDAFFQASLSNVDAARLLPQSGESPSEAVLRYINHQLSQGGADRNAAWTALKDGLAKGTADSKIMAESLVALAKEVRDLKGLSAIQMKGMSPERFASVLSTVGPDHMQMLSSDERSDLMKRCLEVGGRQIGRGSTYISGEIGKSLLELVSPMFTGANSGVESQRFLRSLSTEAFVPLLHTLGSRPEAERLLGGQNAKAVLAEAERRAMDIGRYPDPLSRRGFFIAWADFSDRCAPDPVSRNLTYARMARSMSLEDLKALGTQAGHSDFVRTHERFSNLAKAACAQAKPNSEQAEAVLDLWRNSLRRSRGIVYDTDMSLSEQTVEYLNAVHRLRGSFSAQSLALTDGPPGENIGLVIDRVLSQDRIKLLDPKAQSDLLYMVGKTELDPTHQEKVVRLVTREAIDVMTPDQLKWFKESSKQWMRDILEDTGKFTEGQISDYLANLEEIARQSNADTMSKDLAREILKDLNPDQRRKVTEYLEARKNYLSNKGLRSVHQDLAAELLSGGSQRFRAQPEANRQGMRPVINGLTMKGSLDGNVNAVRFHKNSGIHIKFHEMEMGPNGEVFIIDPNGKRMQADLAKGTATTVKFEGGRWIPGNETVPLGRFVLFDNPHGAGTSDGAFAALKTMQNSDRLLVPEKLVGSLESSRAQAQRVVGFSGAVNCDDIARAEGLPSTRKTVIDNIREAAGVPKTGAENAPAGEPASADEVARLSKSGETIEHQRREARLFHERMRWTVPETTVSGEVNEAGGAKSAGTEGQPAAADVRPATSDAKPGPVEAKPGPAEVKPGGGSGSEGKKETPAQLAKRWRLNMEDAAVLANFAKHWETKDQYQASPDIHQRILKEAGVPAESLRYVVLPYEGSGYEFHKLHSASNPDQVRPGQFERLHALKAAAERGELDGKVLVYIDDAYDDGREGQQKIKDLREIVAASKKGGREGIKAVVIGAWYEFETDSKVSHKYKTAYGSEASGDHVPIKWVKNPVDSLPTAIKKHYAAVAANEAELGRGLPAKLEGDYKKPFWVQADKVADGHRNPGRDTRPHVVCNDSYAGLVRTMLAMGDAPARSSTGFDLYVPLVKILPSYFEKLEANQDAKDDVSRARLLLESCRDTLKGDSGLSRAQSTAVLELMGSLDFLVHNRDTASDAVLRDLMMASENVFPGADQQRMRAMAQMKSDTVANNDTLPAVETVPRPIDSALRYEFKEGVRINTRFGMVSIKGMVVADKPDEPVELEVYKCDKDGKPTSEKLSTTEAGAVLLELRSEVGNSFIRSSIEKSGATRTQALIAYVERLGGIATRSEAPKPIQSPDLSLRQSGELSGLGSERTTRANLRVNEILAPLRERLLSGENVDAATAERYYERARAVLSPLINETARSMGLPDVPMSRIKFAVLGIHEHGALNPRTGDLVINVFEPSPVTAADHELQHKARLLERMAARQADPAAFRRAVLDASLAEVGSPGRRLIDGHIENRPRIADPVAAAEMRDLVRREVLMDLAKKGAMPWSSVPSAEPVLSQRLLDAFRGNVEDVWLEVAKETEHCSRVIALNDASAENLDASDRAYVDRRAGQMLAAGEGQTQIERNPSVQKNIRGIGTDTVARFSGGNANAEGDYRYSLDEISSRKIQAAQELKRLRRELAEANDKTPLSEHARGKVLLNQLETATQQQQMMLSYKSGKIEDARRIAGKLFEKMSGEPGKYGADIAYMQGLGLLPQDTLILDYLKNESMAQPKAMKQFLYEAGRYLPARLAEINNMKFATPELRAEAIAKAVNGFTARFFGIMHGKSMPHGQMLKNLELRPMQSGEQPGLAFESMDGKPLKLIDGKVTTADGKPVAQGSFKSIYRVPVGLFSNPQILLQELYCEGLLGAKQTMDAPERAAKDASTMAEVSTTDSVVRDLTRHVFQNANRETAANELKTLVANGRKAAGEGYADTEKAALTQLRRSQLVMENGVAVFRGHSVDLVAVARDRIKELEQNLEKVRKAREGTSSDPDLPKDPKELELLEKILTERLSEYKPAYAAAERKSFGALHDIAGREIAEMVADAELLRQAGEAAGKGGGGGGRWKSYVFLFTGVAGLFLAAPRPSSAAPVTPIYAPVRSR